MINFLDKKTKHGDIDTIKKIIKNKSLEITENMSKIIEHLEIVKDIDTKDAKDIYIKEKNLLTGLYEYYCKYQKSYYEISFSQILDPIDVATVRNVNLKDFVKQLKELHKKDYEITIESLKDEDKNIIKEIYDKFENDFDDFVNFLINIQSDIIIQETSPIEQNTLLEKIKNKIDFNSILSSYKNEEEKYLHYLDEYNATKELFK